MRMAAALTLILFAQFPGPSEALAAAITHSVQQPEEARPFYRYIWIDYAPEDYDERHVAAVLSYAINAAASHTGIIIQPRAYGRLVAIYLPNYAHHSKLSPDGSGRTQLQALIDTWDSLAIDEPYLHTPPELSGIRASVLAPGIDPQHAQLASELSGNPSLVYMSSWFVARLLDDDYYRFMQFGQTQADVYRSIGVDEQRSQELDGDQRIALFRSGVAGDKPRRVDRLQGVAGRFGTGAVWQTWDLFDESIREQQHPLHNLLRFQPDGGEAIFERPNGLHGFILYDANRQLVKEAPPNLVSDHMIPPPHTRRLRPAISCIRCHGARDGLQDANNDVRTLLDAGVDIVADLDGLDQHDTLLRIAGLYSGDFTRRIELGRDDYERAVRMATQMPGHPEGLSVRETSQLVSAIYAYVRYEPVDAWRALVTLGRDPGDNPRATLSEAVPATTPESVVLAALKAGLSVRVADWEQAFGSVYWRMKGQETDHALSP
jgi:hypothetical protein